MADHAGVRKAKLVVGAHWIWNHGDLNFPTAIQILDFWHATDRLWKIAKAAWDSGSAKVTAWVQAAKTEMEDSDFAAVVSRSAAIKQEVPATASIVDKTATYYRNNKERMDYKRYKAMGLYVGSGAVESACKQVVTQRLKGAGMRWTRAAAQTIANLRCHSLSKQWEGVTEQRNTPRPIFM
ncbi:MAG: hypothetical protein ACLQVD_18050 [Capsulimonadaceae bacterium]